LIIKFRHNYVELNYGTGAGSVGGGPGRGLAPEPGRYFFCCLMVSPNILVGDDSSALWFLRRLYVASWFSISSS